MRKVSLIILLFAVHFVAQAQNISRLEYFFDTDPGYGNGTLVNVTPAASINDLDIPISTSSLTTGFHRLFIRAQNASNEWTHSHFRSLYVASLSASTNITQIEYFIDTDPGFGLGTQVSFSSGASVSNLAIDISAASLSAGFHELYIRAKSNDGQWTHTHVRSFYVARLSTSTNISQIEYFIDTDPGVGMATQVSFTAAPTITDLAVDISAVPLPPGFHRLYVRSKSNDGQWTQTHLRSFYVANSSAGENLVKFEYFFDTDPGFDNGIAANVVPPAVSVNNQDIFADPSSLSLGSHTIYLRGKDSGGEWTQVSSGTFSVAAALPPTISDFTPKSGPDGTLVTITGNFFTGASSVTFGGTPAKSFMVVNSTTVTAVVDAGTTGLISITSPAGTALTSTAFTVTLPNTLAISAQPVSVAVCSGATASLSISASGAPNVVYQWQRFDGATFTNIADGSGVSGATSANLQLSSADLSLAGDYRCKVSGDLAPDIFSNTVTVTINSSPAAPTVSGDSGCSGASLTLTASGGTNGQYKWYTQPSGGTVISGEVNDTFTTPVLSQTTDYYVSVDNGVCESPRSLVTATINAIPNSPTTTSGSVCGGGAATLRASGGSDGQYRWYTQPTGGAAINDEVNNIFMTPFITTTTTYYVSIDNSLCESTRVAVDAVVLPTPSQPVITPSGNITICNGQQAILSTSLAAGYSWSNGGDGQQITISSAGSYTVVITDNNGCTSVASAAVTIVTQDCSNNQPPVIANQSATTEVGGSVTLDVFDLLSDPDGNLDLSTLRIIAQPISGAKAELVNGGLLIDYNNVAFSGTDRVRIEVCDITGSCTQEDIFIEVIGDIIVYNAVSPNGDQKNDILLIEYIDLIPQTRNNLVQIFNRWGDLVWETKDYDNTTHVFQGLSSSNESLPSGTYFYKISFPSSKSTLTGFLELKH